MRKIIGFGMLLLILGLFYQERNKKPSDTPRQPASSSLVPPQLKTRRSSEGLPLTKQKILSPLQNENALDLCWRKIEAQGLNEEVFNERVYKKLSPLIGNWIFREEGVVDAATSISKIDFLWRGLESSGMLFGRVNEKPNLELALEFLGRAHELEPKNSAPLLFAALIEKERGRQDVADQLFLEAVTNSSYFSTHILEINKAVLREVRSPSDLIWNASLRARINTPNLTRLSEFLRSVDGHSFGTQLTSKALHQDKIIEGVEYDYFEFAIGMSLMKAGNIEADYPAMSETIEQKKKLDFTRTGAEWSLIDRSCDLQSLVPIVEKIRDYDYN